MAKYNLIITRTGRVYANRGALEVLSENPLTDTEIVINELFEEIQLLKQNPSHTIMEVTMSQKQMKPDPELVEDVITSSDQDGFTIWYGQMPVNFTHERAVILFCKLNAYLSKQMHEKPEKK